MTTRLLINSISNCARLPRLGDAFDALFADYQRQVNALTKEVVSSAEELGCVYVQFQFDADWPKAARGICLKRYSKQYNDIQATVEVSAAEFGGSSRKRQKLLLCDRLVKVLRQVELKCVKLRIRQGIPELIVQIEVLNERFCS